MTNLMNKHCQHPNCRCMGIKYHPKHKDKILCEEHYVEVLSAIKSNYKIVVLTN